MPSITIAFLVQIASSWKVEIGDDLSAWEKSVYRVPAAFLLHVMVPNLVETSICSY